MSISKKSKVRAEFGDFQTPEALAARMCGLLARLGVRPRSLVEPTVGGGSILRAGLKQFPECQSAVGADINADYIEAVRARFGTGPDAERVSLFVGDFFTTDWHEVCSSLPEPMLVAGNPPWVTNAGVGALGGANLPPKANSHGHKGLDAITGKSNFDISEWMMLAMLEWFREKDGDLAMLCKTVVARKILLQAWKGDSRVRQSTMFRIDACEHFGASVDACLLLVRFGGGAVSRVCQVYADFSAAEPVAEFGYHDGQLVANGMLYERCKHLQGPERVRWRSGLKHDCAKVMEFTSTPDGLCNGHGERVDLEDRYLYPMLKSSDLANGERTRASRWMLVTQQTVGEDTEGIRYTAPRTWAYLEKHAAALDRRASSIYRGRPRFSVFGVGAYSFAPWKVAVSGLYKRLHFRVVGPYKGKPTVLDDTGYFLPCETQGQAEALARLLNSETAREFYEGFIFWDSKRPITIDVLRRLDLLALARHMGCDEETERFLSGEEEATRQRAETPGQGDFFTEEV